MRVIEIRVVDNGYVVIMPDNHGPLHQSAYVFNAFEDLLEWLGDNLNKPAEQLEKPAITLADPVNPVFDGPVKAIDPVFRSE